MMLFYGLLRLRAMAKEKYKQKWASPNPAHDECNRSKGTIFVRNTNIQKNLQIKKVI
jgi:hypothetical protein